MPTLVEALQRRCNAWNAAPDRSYWGMEPSEKEEWAKQNPYKVVLQQAQDAEQLAKHRAEKVSPSRDNEIPNASPRGHVYSRTLKSLCQYYFHCHPKAIVYHEETHTTL